MNTVTDKATGETLRFVEVLRNFRIKDVSYYAGERVAVSEEKARRWCTAGWCSDPTGEFTTGEPNVAPKKLEIQNGKHAARTTNL